MPEAVKCSMLQLMLYQPSNCPALWTNKFSFSLNGDLGRIVSTYVQKIQHKRIQANMVLLVISAGSTRMMFLPLQGIIIERQSSAKKPAWSRTY